jgi:hypothetical protein
LGKTLCGNDFYFRLEDYGFTVKTKKEDEVIMLSANDTRFNLTKLENATILQSSLDYWRDWNFASFKLHFFFFFFHRRGR